MKYLNKNLAFIFAMALIVSSCSSMNRTQKGAVIGTAAGGAMGAVIGEASDNPALGAIIGATVGGVAGAIIGNEMDKQAAEIENAVPDAKVARVGEGIVVEFSNNILFEFDRYDLSSEAQENLEKFKVILNDYPDTNIEIQGHTDSSGSESYNQTLSERRATSVSFYLVNTGIKSERVNTVGFGETTPRYDNSTGNGRAQNRRVDFLITANEKMISEAEKEANE